MQAGIPASVTEHAFLLAMRLGRNDSDCFPAVAQCQVAQHLLGRLQDLTIALAMSHSTVEPGARTDQQTALSAMLAAQTWYQESSVPYAEPCLHQNTARLQSTAKLCVPYPATNEASGQ